MFTPSQHDVRRFFCQVAKKVREKSPLSPLDALAADWIGQHPEYDQDLLDEEQAILKNYAVDDGKTNPFLHLAMHLSISEQCSIDQPTGIKQAIDLLAKRKSSLHDAHHLAMECLGQMIWTSQRSGLPPDGQVYLESIRRLATV